MVSSPCFEFGVALRTSHDLLKSVNAGPGKPGPYKYVERRSSKSTGQTIFFQGGTRSYFFTPDAPCRESCSSLAGTKILQPPVGSLCRLPTRNGTR